MKLSTKTRYGTRAMVEIARVYPHSLIKRRDISLTQEISTAYLEQILASLRTSGLIKTTRGANGGFELGAPPDKITLFQIITSLEGSISPVDCIEEGSCDRIGCCVTRNIWQKLYEAQKELFEAYTLQDLLEMENGPAALHYDI